jgi:hypothetical protein
MATSMDPMMTVDVVGLVVKGLKYQLGGIEES